MGKTEQYKQYYEDEISLFELFKKIWKWKWLTIALVVIVTLSTFFYINITPDTFTVRAIIKIGKIAGFPLESVDNIKHYLYRRAIEEKVDCFKNIKFKEIKPTSKLIIYESMIDFGFEVSYSSLSAESSYSCLQKCIKIILDRHNKIYKKAATETNKNINLIKSKEVIDPKFILESYNYSTHLISELVLPVEPDNKKLKLKIFVAFIFSLFMGIFLSFFIEYIIYEKKKSNMSPE